MTSDRHARRTSAPEADEAPPDEMASDIGGVVLSRVLPPVALVVIVVMIVAIVVSR